MYRIFRSKARENGREGMGEGAIRGEWKGKGRENKHSTQSMGQTGNYLIRVREKESHKYSSNTQEL